MSKIFLKQGKIGCSKFDTLVVKQKYGPPRRVTTNLRRVVVVVSSNSTVSTMMFH